MNSEDQERDLFVGPKGTANRTQYLTLASAASLAFLFTLALYTWQGGQCFKPAGLCHVCERSTGYRCFPSAQVNEDFIDVARCGCALLYLVSLGHGYCSFTATHTVQLELYRLTHEGHDRRRVLFSFRPIDSLLARVGVSQPQSSK